MARRSKEAAPGRSPAARRTPAKAERARPATAGFEDSAARDNSGTASADGRIIARSHTPSSVCGAVGPKTISSIRTTCDSARRAATLSPARTRNWPRSRAACVLCGGPFRRTLAAVSPGLPRRGVAAQPYSAGRRAPAKADWSPPPTRPSTLRIDQRAYDACDPGLRNLHLDESTSEYKKRRASWKKRAGGVALWPRDGGLVERAVPESGNQSDQNWNLATNWPLRWPPMELGFVMYPNPLVGAPIVFVTRVANGLLLDGPGR
jgi:hypothetical protein